MLLCSPGCYGHKLWCCFECQLAHADEVLRNLRHTLLVLVNQELGPVHQVLVYLLQGLCVVALELDFLPHVLGRVCSLYCLHVQVAASVFLLDCGIPAVGQRAGGAVAQTCDVVLIPAEVLRLGFGLEAAVVVVDDLPDDLVVLHGCLGCYSLSPRLL